MPHVIILLDDDGNPIGEYYPPHDPETGGRSTTGSITLNEGFVAALDSFNDKHPLEPGDTVTVKFHRKQG